MTRDCVRDHPDGSLLLVRVVPGASVAQISGTHGNDPVELKVRVCTPPVDGRANDEVVRVVAAALKLRGREVALVAGHAARSKQLAIALPAVELRRRVRLLIGACVVTER